MEEMQMVEIVRLKPGEAPLEPHYVLVEPIECGVCEMIQHGQGVTYRVREKYLEYEVECLRQRLDEAGLDRLYVRETAKAKQG
jgi:hypothetical protein